MAVALFTAVLLFQLPALVRAQQPCTGPPPLSNTIASQNPVCPDQPFTLSLAGFTPQQGMTFEWRSSPDGQSFSPIQGGNGPILNQVQDGSTFFNCIVTCSQSGLSTPSIPVQVGMTQAIAQYPLQNVQLSATESTAPEHTGFVTYSSVSA